MRDDWPRGPYVAVFMTDDPARHRAAIKRLAAHPQSTRVVRVRYSARDKDRIQKRIQRDVEKLERVGFEVLETETDWGVDRIDIELVTRRSDHARYFARRYGSVVKTHATRSHTFPACVNAATYEIAPDGMSLTVRWDDAAKQAGAHRADPARGPGGDRGRRASQRLSRLRRRQREAVVRLRAAARRAPRLRRLRRFAAAPDRPVAR